MTDAKNFHTVNINQKKTMNTLLIDLYNEMLGKNWNIESINNKFNAMNGTLRLRETNIVEVQELMKNKTHVEELAEKISNRLKELGIALNAFNELERQNSNYYEEN